MKDLGELYHDYSFFGLKNKQLSGSFKVNQERKAPILIAYIAYARAKTKKPSFTELFCADGYYSMVAAHLGCNPVMGIDSNKDGYSGKAPLIAEKLGLDVQFKTEVITPQSKFESDIVLNAGGLYHVDEPEKILELSYRMARKYLIVQSVVSLATKDPDYFESPAPGWGWGSRHSRQSFDKMIRSHCPNVVDSHFNELATSSETSRGSVYYLIKK